MSNECTEKDLRAFDLSEIVEAPPPARINLATSEDVRREMAKVYREARLNKLPISDATKLSYMLTQILKAHELIALESRIELLEKAL